MKKVLSVFLAAMLLLSCSPLLLGLGFAEDPPYTFDTDETFISSSELVSGKTYIVRSGVTVTVPDDLTVYVPNNCMLKVEEGGTLVVENNGSLIVEKNGHLKIDGNLIGAENVSGQGEIVALVRFPSLSREGLQDYVKIYYASSQNEDPYEDVQSNFTAIAVDDAGQDIYCPLNRYLFIKADIIKDGDLMNEKYDDGLFKVYLDRVEMPYAAEYHRLKLVDSHSVSYSKWTSDSDFLKTYRVKLSSGAGYTVVGRDGEEGEALIKYGSPFKFRLEIDEDYQMSGTTADVYIYNGYGVVNYDHNDPNQGTVKASTPDASGYYTIPAVIHDYTVYVSMLSIPDDKVTQIGSILQTVRSIFEMIINFFRQIANAFGIGG